MMHFIRSHSPKQGAASGQKPARPIQRRTRTHLQVEELETRLAPSTDLLSNAVAPAAIPAAHVATSNSAEPAGGPGQPAGFNPQQISQAYGFNQITFNNGTVTGDGSGQTIAIIDAYSQPDIVSDLATFDSMYGLAAPPSFTVVNQTGGSSLPAADQNWGMEISLDVEWAHAMAPGASILLVEANSNSYSDLLAAVNYARNQPGVSVVSMSWGGNEWSSESGDNSYFTTPAGHNGVTFVAATGDSGSSGAPEFPSVSPNVLAVGGTELSTDSAGNYLSETGWSGSGGGISLYDAQPSYQQGVVTQSTTMRTVPDVSYNASSNSPYAVYDTSYSGWIQVYGTSAGAPQWASLVAIADQGRALNNQGTLDGITQTLPAIYQLPSSDFHDITSGSNGAYSAGPGYDLVTGIGSPVANLVVSGLVSYGGGQPTNSPPWVVAPASATPNPIAGTTTNLSVLGGDNGGASSLTYTWSVSSEPAGAPMPTFSVNASNAAQNSMATFYQAGTYTFLATITDSGGLTATSSVTVTVNQTLSRLAITPGSASLTGGGSQQFTASAEDQFGQALSTPPSFTWTLAAGGMGALSSSGLYTAPSLGSGTDTVQASADGLTGSASVTFGSVPAAPSNLVATAVSYHQVNLSWTDNSNNETGFIIQRSTNGTSWTQIATVSAAVTSYSDKSVSKRKTYEYRVCACNSYGDSTYSNVATVVTPAVQIKAGASTTSGSTGRPSAGPGDLPATGNGSGTALQNTSASPPAAEGFWSDPTVVNALLRSSHGTASGDVFWMLWSASLARGGPGR